MKYFARKESFLVILVITVAMSFILYDGYKREQFEEGFDFYLENLTASDVNEIRFYQRNGVDGLSQIYTVDNYDDIKDILILLKNGKSYMPQHPSFDNVIYMDLLDKNNSVILKTFLGALKNEENLYVDYMDMSEKSFISNDLYNKLKKLGLIEWDILISFYIKLRGGEPLCFV